jgi:Zn-dependent peptidase ImmA (M78 family)
MERVRVGGRSYSDPDVVALIRASGGLVDPRSLVLTQASKLNEQYRMFDSSGVLPFARLVQMASLKGLEILPMDAERRRSETRDAVILLNGRSKGKKGQIFYNPDRPSGRVAFSIAHEISHTFFPTTSGGARFREMCDSDSREANELERLCDLGASEILMPREEFRTEVGREWSVSSVPRLVQRFGSSFEATLFRLASAYPGTAAAGLLKFRRRKEEQRAIERMQIVVGQRSLFSVQTRITSDVPEPKYRRQSFHMSDRFPDRLIVRWNKSFDAESIIVQAADLGGVLTANEPLPNGSDLVGRLEAVVAPYQRDDADADHPDVLFFWVSDSN